MKKGCEHDNTIMEGECYCLYDPLTYAEEFANLQRDMTPLRENEYKVLCYVLRGMEQELRDDYLHTIHDDLLEQKIRYDALAKLRNLGFNVDDVTVMGGQVDTHQEVHGRLGTIQTF